MARTATGPRPLSDLSSDELDAFFVERGLPRSHADRIASAALRRGVTDLLAVDGLGPRVRETVAASLALRALPVVERSCSLDGTTKLLVELPDGERVESVLMPLARAYSGCVSSQVGCAAACAFCASGLEGLRRSLEPWEIVEQVLRLDDEARTHGRRLTNLVFMGMGEPLHAYDRVVAAIRRLIDRRLMGFGPSRITVSTVGVVPGILRLAREGLGVHLAVSIHAADDALRKTLLPVGGAWSVADVLDAAEVFRTSTGRFVNLQITLLAGVNDAPIHAEALARAIAGRPFHVNLIPVNPVAGTAFGPPTQATLDAFRSVLVHAGVVAHVRTRRGSDVAAACGQLRRRSGARAPSAEEPVPPFRSPRAPLQ